MQKGIKRSIKNKRRAQNKKSQARFLSKLLLKYGTKTNPENGETTSTGFTIDQNYAKTKWGGSRFSEILDWHLEKKKKQEEKRKAILMGKVSVK